jgi:hypothetical protein
MIVRVLKDTTLTVKAGQTVEVDDRDGLIALNMGAVEPATKPAVKKSAKKKAAE